MPNPCVKNATATGDSLPQAMSTTSRKSHTGVHHWTWRTYKACAIVAIAVKPCGNDTQDPRPRQISRRSKLVSDYGPSHMPLINLSRIKFCTNNQVVTTRHGFAWRSAHACQLIAHETYDNRARGGLNPYGDRNRQRAGNHTHNFAQSKIKKAGGRRGALCGGD